LSVTQGTNRLLLKCHAGCSQTAVIDALRARDLWDRRTTYDYRDSDGTLLYQAVRLEIPGQEKTFFQRRPDGKGDWINKTKGCKRVPYRLPELLKAAADSHVFVVEGEKDADRLASLGLVATTNVGGAGKGKWLAEYNAYLRDRHVVALADNDQAGLEHREEVVRSLLTVAATVIAPDLPDTGDKEDVSDWLDHGHTVDELLELATSTAPRQIGTAVADEEDAFLLGAIPAFPIDALPDAAKPLVQESSLPTNLLAGGVLAAVMAAAGGQVEVEIHPTWVERLNEFVALVAPRTAGKSPTLELAFDPLEAADQQRRQQFQEELVAWAALDAKERRQEPRPQDATLLRSSFTIEAVIRQLYRQPSTAFVVDELSTTLRGLNQYHPDGQGNDLGHLLQMWNGGPLRYMRVGRGEGPDNSVDILVPRPTVVLVGGLQPYLQTLLGGDEEGLRPRWLLHVASFERTPVRFPGDVALTTYARLIGRLLERRAVRRRWVLGDSAKRAFLELVEDWKARARSVDGSPSATAALGKADRHCARIAGALAECMLEVLPSDPRVLDALELPLDALVAAAEWVEFVAAGWDALLNGSPLSLSLRDRQLDQAIDRLIAYLEEHGTVTARTLRRNGVAGIDSQSELEAVVDRYRQRRPGCVQVVHPTGGGPASVLLSPPKRVDVRGAPPPPPVSCPPEGSARPRDSDFENESVPVEPKAPPDERSDVPDERSDVPDERWTETVVCRVDETEAERLSGGEHVNGAVADGSPHALLEQTSFVAAAVTSRPTKAARAPKPRPLPNYPTPPYTVVQDPAQLAELADQLLHADVVGVDTETTSLHVADGRLRLVQLAFGERAWLLDVDALGPDPILAALGPFLGNSEAPLLAFHNAPFDLVWLGALGLPPVPPERVFDTQVAAFLLLARGSRPKTGDADADDRTPPRKYGLKDLLERYLDCTLSKDLQQAGWDAAELDPELLAYGARDADATAALARHLSSELERRDLLGAMAFEMATLPALVELHASGVLIDQDGWRRQAAEVAALADGMLRDELVAAYGPRDAPEAQQRAFWRSRTKKLALLNELGIPAKETNENHLLGVAGGHPLVPRLIAWQKLDHTAATYGERYLGRHIASNGRLFPGWRLLGSDVGRMSCLEPNLQNLPRAFDYRKLVIAPEGRCFVRADYAALHPRIIAHLAPEPVLIERYRADPHADAYRHLAARINRWDDELLVTKEQRRTGKLVFLGFMYGAKAPRFRSEVRANEGVEYSLDEAQRFREAFLDAYPGIRRWHARFDWETPATIVDVHTGRRRELVTSANEKINTPVLMIESAGMKRAMQDLLRTHDRVPRARLVAAIHDELIVETDVADAERTATWASACMQAAMQTLIPNVPVVVETAICANYAGAPLPNGVPPMA
jgi:DNA polymerase-1